LGQVPAERYQHLLEVNEEKKTVDASALGMKN
jgi:hypothetical protein